MTIIPHPETLKRYAEFRAEGLSINPKTVRAEVVPEEDGSYTAYADMLHLYREDGSSPQSLAVQAQGSSAEFAANELRRMLAGYSVSLSGWAVAAE